MQALPDLVYLESACVCAGVAACTDLRSRRIPNWLTASGFIAGLALHLALAGPRQAALALLAGFLTGGFFLLFFLAGGMGAGDVKLMAAVGSLAGLPSIRPVLIATVLFGALGALVTALAGGRLRETFANSCALLAHHQAHGLVQHPDFNVRNGSMLRMPYAIPIAAGCALTLYLQIRGGFAL